MKGTELQKAQLLDELMANLGPCFTVAWHDEHAQDMILEAKQKYDAIMAEKTLSKDPFADEVFQGNCGSRLMHHALEMLNEGLVYPPYERKTLRLSQFPHFEKFLGRRGINRKSLWVYETVMKEHGFHDKLPQE